MSTLPQLPLRPPHVHDWVLVEVEYDDFGAVRLYECRDCAEVHYA